MTTTQLRNSLSVLIAIISLSIAAFAQTSPSHFDGIKIKNFGQMDSNFYRGAQPDPDDYQSLKNLGVKTVVDLQDSPTDYEKKTVEALGMKYVNIPMSGMGTPKMSDINTFLALFDNPDTGAVYLHCAAGIHRTGVLGAAYRYKKSGWDYDKVYKEMKNYNFSAGLFHGGYKSFVEDWGKKVAAEKAASATTGGNTATAAASSARTSN
jgi:tyrosine-protein phosphatase SIW14